MPSSTRPDDEAILLGADDVPEMLALVERNQPGPFRPRTYELGRYIGFRRDGRLVAMAGERLHPQGGPRSAPWRRMPSTAARVSHRGSCSMWRSTSRARGDRALMHAAATNVGAIAAYERLGFTLRRHTVFAAVRTPRDAREHSRADTGRRKTIPTAS